MGGLPRPANRKHWNALHARRRRMANGTSQHHPDGAPMKRALVATIVLLTSPALIGQKTVSDGIKELATQISTSAAKQEKQRIAVIPFHELEGQPTVFGTYVAEE